jgi:hypothetical protein
MNVVLPVELEQGHGAAQAVAGEGTFHPQAQPEREGTGGGKRADRVQPEEVPF